MGLSLAGKMEIKKKGFMRSLCYNPTVYSNYFLGMLLCKDKLQITVQTGWKDQLTF